jgi:hypothetical protein
MYTMHANTCTYINIDEQVDSWIVPPTHLYYVAPLWVFWAFFLLFFPLVPLVYSLCTKGCAPLRFWCILLTYQKKKKKEPSMFCDFFVLLHRILWDVFHKKCSLWWLSLNPAYSKPKGEYIYILEVLSYLYHHLKHQCLRSIPNLFSSLIPFVHV